MKKKLSSLLVVFTVVLAIGVGSAAAFEQITAQEAYDMVLDDEAILIDVRTLEECYWVGMPAKYDVTGKLVPIAVIIPFNLMEIDNAGSVTGKPVDPEIPTNLDFQDLVEQEFDKGQALITMCRSGGRSTYAARLLEELEFTNVYELDNALKEAANGVGGRGGFQGTSYVTDFDGYRGYPERLPQNNSSWKITVETVTEEINNAEDSVSWVDTGLPITQKVDPSLIPTLE